MKSNLLKKYDIPVPRYTSYPTVPYWQAEKPSQEAWAERVGAAFELNPEISLYIHLPYCERLCTYCGCNKRKLDYLGAVGAFNKAVFALKVAKGEDL